MSQLSLTHPTPPRFFLANGNNVLSVSFQRMVGVVTYVFNHFENNIGWVIRTSKIILKNSFVPPHPHVPTSHQKNLFSEFYYEYHAGDG